jgi:hypothetical protein|tara:strand:+ start:2651 stop:2878 length:228 start_codon:yes stop_codon:yes gene_type:complete
MSRPLPNQILFDLPNGKVISIVQNKEKNDGGGAYGDYGKSVEVGVWEKNYDWVPMEIHPWLPLKKLLVLLKNVSK